jgi:transcription-repair coupling factor (superfamily II helicase)
LIDSNKIGDGFKIASRDMEIRGVGNLLGKEQHGSACIIGLNLYSKLLAKIPAKACPA